MVVFVARPIPVNVQRVGQDLGVILVRISFTKIYRLFSVKVDEISHLLHSFLND